MRGVEAGALSPAYYQPHPSEREFCCPITVGILWQTPSNLASTKVSDSNLTFQKKKKKCTCTVRGFFKVHWGKKCAFDSYETDNLNHSLFWRHQTNCWLVDLMILSRISPSQYVQNALKEALRESESGTFRNRRALLAHLWKETSVTTQSAVFWGDKRASVGKTWLDFRGLNCHSEWQSAPLAEPLKGKHFVGENGHFLSVHGASKPCWSPPWIIHPSLRPHSVFCRAFFSVGKLCSPLLSLWLNYKQVAFFFSSSQSCFQAGLLSARSPSVSPK